VFAVLVTGLTDGTTYQVSVEVRNAAGDSDAASAPVTPCLGCQVTKLPSNGTAFTLNTGSTSSDCPGTMGATSTDTIVSCLTLTSGQTTDKAGLIAALREEAAQTSCGGGPCIGDQQVTFDLSGGTTCNPSTGVGCKQFDEYFILDKTISTDVYGGPCTDKASGGCHVYTVYMDPGNTPIGSSIKSKWCADKVIFPGAPGCVVQVVPLTNNTASNGQKGVKTDNRNGDILIEVVYWGDAGFRTG